MLTISARRQTKSPIEEKVELVSSESSDSSSLNDSRTALAEDKRVKKVVLTLEE
jgi:hypothetical protein